MEQLAALAAAIVIPTIAPGPNNFIVMTQATAGGVRRAAPSILAIALGSAIMLAAAIAAVSLEFVDRARPWIAAVGSLLLVDIAVRHWLRAGHPDAVGPPLGSAASLIPLQWLNPNAWVLTILVAAASQSLGSSPPAALMLLAGISVGCSLLWAFLGGMLSSFAHEPKRRLWLDRILSAALLIAALQLLVTQIGDLS